MTPTCEAATPPTTGPIGRWSTRTQIVAATCACAGASAFLYAVDPSRYAVYPQCLFYRMTGMYCAGCGATRAAYALLHGRVVDALHDNVLFVAALPFVLFLIGSHLLTAWRSNAWPKVFVDPRSLTPRGIWILSGLALFMVVRNVPCWPFEWLRPLTS